ncbi:MAG: hypothetical protein LQ341_003927 [Variospora aurantia]|nr:MAG: hypothetical protein LQ341_003927 [Variospora aurantia]
MSLAPWGTLRSGLFKTDEQLEEGQGPEPGRWADCRKNSAPVSAALNKDCQGEGQLDEIDKGGTV